MVLAWCHMLDALQALVQTPPMLSMQSGHRFYLSCGFQSVKSNAGGSVQSTWLIGNALGGGRAARMAIDLQKDGRGGLVPWAGVAARLPGAHQQAQQMQHALTQTGEDGDVHSASSLSGQAFCFLPLPCQTGQPLSSSP